MGNEIINKETGEITQFKPEKSAARVAVIDHAYSRAKQLKDYSAMANAIIEKFEEQEKFLAWWDAVERRGGDVKSDQSKFKHTLILADYGFTKIQLHEWRKRDRSKAEAKALEKARVWCEGRAQQEHIVAAPTPVPSGKYRTIVIDPPWDIKKIHREDHGLHQTGLDYPTMSLSELADFEPMQSCPFDECHLYCWTTQKYLPATFQLLRDWGFKYIFTMTWHKSGGFQPFGLPQYNSEFVVFGRRGSLPFKDTKAFNTCFSAPRREHSRKPDEFYDVVRRVSPGPRIDIFSRETREGFDVYGNQEGVLDGI